MFHQLCKLIGFIVLGTLVAQAAIQVSLTPSAPSPQPVGTFLIWTAQATDANPGEIDYRFLIRRQGNGGFDVVRDYHPAGVLHWIPSDGEGLFEVEVTARNRDTGETASDVQFFGVSALGLGIFSVVTETLHPLLPLYTAPPCPAGSYIRVRFTGGNVTRYTPWKACEPGRTSNFYLAGMLPGVTHVVNHEIRTGSMSQEGPTHLHRAGTLPWWLPSPDYTVINPPDAQTCLLEGIVLHSHVKGALLDDIALTATDLLGRVVWYAPPLINDEGWILRPVAGGTLLLALSDTTIQPPGLNQDQILREMDLMGSIVRETNVTRVSEQLVKLGYDPITSFHHDAIRLPNGHTIALASAERIVRDIQGPGEVDVIGDMLVDLDENFQVVWAWNSFETMDLSRVALLGETCRNEQPGCPPVFLAPVANDWTHANSVHYTPGDGNLIVSVRHQDWVIKIDYRDGLGTGAIVWRMGKDGDFSIDSSDPYPWFSHQHDAEFDVAGVPVMSIYDNGNVRVLGSPGNSRGQTFLVDEAQRRVYPLLNVDLGVYAFAVGSAERLCNGNYSFDSGIVGATQHAQTLEVTPIGIPTFLLESSAPAYRTFRMIDLYTP